MKHESLKSILREKSIKISAMARDTGIPYSTLNDIVNGKTSLGGARFEYVIVIADYLNKSLDDMKKIMESKDNREEGWRIITKSKKYFLDCPELSSEPVLLCKVNNTNSRFVNTMAKWELQYLKDQKELKEWATVKDKIGNNIGRRMSWEEIAKCYPDMYVALEDYQTSKSDTSGILRGVAETQDELFPLLSEYAAAGNMLYCFYTTEDMSFIPSTL